MIRQDRGFAVWLQLMPPAILLAAAASGIVLLDFLGRNEGLLFLLCCTAMALSTVWLLRIGLGKWQRIEE